MIYIVKHKPYKNKVPNGYAELYVGNLFKDFNGLKPEENDASPISVGTERKTIVCGPPKANESTIPTLETSNSSHKQLITSFESESSINHLNLYLNEATAMYDIWKNKADEIVGMCHYRRFLIP